MHAQIIVFCIVGILSKTWTNALYVLQVDKKIMPVIVVATLIKIQWMGTKGRGRVLLASTNVTTERAAMTLADANGVAGIS